MKDSANKASVVYVIAGHLRHLDHVTLALARLRAWVGATGKIVVVADPAVLLRSRCELQEAGADTLLELLPQCPTGGDATLIGYQRGLLHLRQSCSCPAKMHPVILTGAHVLGPIVGSMPNTSDLPDGPALISAYWNDPSDPKPIFHMPSLDFVILTSRLLVMPAFWTFWDSDRGHDPTSDRMALVQLLQDNAVSVAFLLSASTFATPQPALQEIHGLIGGGSPCLPLATLTLDPLLHDIQALRLRDAIDALRNHDPELYRATISYVTRHLEMRDFNTIADQYEVIANTSPSDANKPRAFGTLAVFIHAYYSEMMDEFWVLIDRLPPDRHLFITTACVKERDAIQRYLRNHGVGTASMTVRVVAQNRGRDMGSLFITWRDVVLSGRYSVALRLHSKRTPQVAPQVGQSFKAHLFDNLVGSRGHVSGILDLIDAQPDIGMIIAPVIHIGFATLGHGWFNNLNGVQVAMLRLGIDVPLDANTPVAANGTMYWFRTDALRMMFETPWQWEEYNAEPNHVDGGLAHVQERLLGYCAQARGYRVVSVLTPKSAARGYAHLEYKLQRLAAHLPNGNIVDQDRELSGLNSLLRLRLYRFLRQLYGRTIARWPATRKTLRPLAMSLSLVLLRGRSG